MRILLCGYKGKTGKEVYEVLKQEYEVYGLEKEDDIESYMNRYDLLIDFTDSKSSFNHMCYCIEKRIDFICGSTTFTNEEINYIKEGCKRSNIKGVICYNFSYPINLILKSLNDYQTYFDKITYIDFHNSSKKDKTSGTNILFKAKCNKINTISIKNDKNKITYILTLEGKYDKITLSYQVNSRKVYALGLLNYLHGDKENIINLLDD